MWLQVAAAAGSRDHMVSSFARSRRVRGISINNVWIASFCCKNRNGNRTSRQGVSDSSEGRVSYRSYGILSNVRESSEETVAALFVGSLTGRQKQKEIRGIQTGSGAPPFMVQCSHIEPRLKGCVWYLFIEMLYLQWNSG